MLDTVQEISRYFAVIFGKIEIIPVFIDISSKLGVSDVFESISFFVCQSMSNFTQNVMNEF